MDCKTARMLAELRGNRTSELPAEDAVDLDLHLQSCPSCQRLIEIERKLDAPIAKAMRTVPIPLGLKSRILDQLATQRGAVHRRRFYYAAAAAACVFVALGLLFWNPQEQVKFDLNELVNSANRNAEEPQKQVDEWLSAQKIAYNPPAALNANLLAFHGMSTFKGKLVPTLCYRNSEGNGFAEVYILREADFDLSELPESYSGSAIGRQVMVRRDKANKLAYVILFTGDSLEPFLTHTPTT